MRNKKITISAVASLLIATNLFSQELSSVTVYSATKSEQSIKDVTSNVNVITKEELEEKHYTSVAQALDSLPGVSFTSNGGIGSTVSLSLRGTSNNRTLILIDGVKYKDQSSISGTDISTLMVTDIERIEVIKGAQSGIWGADAAAGVVNIITKKANSGLNGSAQVEVGSFDSKKYAASISYGTEKFDLKLNAQRLTSDEFTSQAPRGDNIELYEDDKYENTTLSLKANYYINKDSKLNFNITDIDSTKDYDSFSNPDDTLMKNDSQSRTYSASYEQNYKNHKFVLKADKNKIERDQVGTTWGVKETNNESKNIELMDNISYNEKDFILMGLGVTEDDVDFTNADGTSDNASNDSKYVYATNSNYFNNIILTQSLRYDDYDNFKSKTTGKIGAKYHINSDFEISANFGTAYSVPQLIQNINPWGSSNFDIEPEKTKTYDVGFAYKGFQATYFYQKVKDLIEWYDPTPNDYGNNDAIYRNLEGTSTLKGFELSYKKEIFSDALLSLNYTRLSAKNNDNEKLARKPEDNIKVSLDYYGFKNMHLNLNAKYIGERFDRVNEQGQQTGKYTVWGAVMNYKFNKNFSSYVKLDNIFDKYYQVVDGYATSPRALTLGLKYNF